MLTTDKVGSCGEGTGGTRLGGDSTGPRVSFIRLQSSALDSDMSLSPGDGSDSVGVLDLGGSSVAEQVIVLVLFGR